MKARGASVPASNFTPAAASARVRSRLKELFTTTGSGRRFGLAFSSQPPWMIPGTYLLLSGWVAALSKLLAYGWYKTSVGVTRVPFLASVWRTFAHFAASYDDRI